MRKLLNIIVALLLSSPMLSATFVARVGARVMQEEQERRVLTVPQTGRRRRVRGDTRQGRGIRSAFKKAGKGAGRGGKRFGQNMAKGRPVRAGKELGKGMGTFGKHTGKGVARTMKRTFKP